MYFNIRKIDLSTKTPVYSVQFLYETENTVSLSLTKSRNWQGEASLAAARETNPFLPDPFPDFPPPTPHRKAGDTRPWEERKRRLTCKIFNFYPYEGIGAGKARGVYHFYGNWLFSLPFFGKTAKRFCLVPWAENTVYYFVKYLYTGVACPV